MLNDCEYCISPYFMFLLQKSCSHDEMKYHLSEFTLNIFALKRSNRGSNFIDQCYSDNNMWCDIHIKESIFTHKNSSFLLFIINQGEELLNKNCSSDLYIDLGLVFQIVLYHSVWSVIKIVFTCVLYMSRKLQPLWFWINYLGMATELLSLLLSWM